MWIFDLGRIRQSSPTMRGGKRSKEEEEGPLLHAPLPPKGVLRCLRSSGLTFSFSQFRVRRCSYTSIYFFEKIFGKIFWIFPGNLFFSETLSLRLPFCWPSFLGAIFSALSPGFIVLRKWILRFSSFSTYFCVPPHVFWRLVPPVLPVVFYDEHLTMFFVWSLSSSLKYIIMDECLFRRIFFCASIGNIDRN